MARRAPPSTSAIRRIRTASKPGPGTGVTGSGGKSSLAGRDRAAPRSPPRCDCIARPGRGVAGAVLGYFGLREARRSSQGLTRIATEVFELEAHRSFLSGPISPTVGTIQFLKNGLSISLEAVQYRADGLYLRGELGNTRVVTISNVTLKVKAHPPLYEMAKRGGELLIEDGFIGFPAQTGEGQKVTALCPRCGIDSVIGSPSGYPVTPEFLGRTREHWFG